MSETDALDLAGLARRRHEAETAFAHAIDAERDRLTRELRARREALGMTQQDVALIAGCSRGQIANGERGADGARLSTEVLIAYATAVGCRLTLEVTDTPARGRGTAAADSAGEGR